jgi:hypothetical protein
MNLLFIGSNNTFKSRIITLLVEEFYKKKKINVFKHLVMNIDCFMDITFSNSINEIKTFCKTNTIHPKIVVIDNFDIINESNQIYLSKLKKFLISLDKNSICSITTFFSI